MFIDDLIAALKQVRQDEGNIKVVVTHSLIVAAPTDIFEAGVGKLSVEDRPAHGGKVVHLTR